MFDIRRSSKSYINSEEHYAVIKDSTVFLRILGQEGHYLIVTATAGEDNGSLAPYRNPKALIKAALEVSLEINTTPKFLKDYKGREYIEIASCEYISDAYRAAEILFDKLSSNIDDYGKDDMSSLYETLSNDENGEDIYLSDGMWLSSDGNLKDLGR